MPELSNIKRSLNKVSIVILNYNGEEILPKCLPSIAEAAVGSPVPCEVVILDNKSTDNGLNYVRKNFPQFKIVVSNENKILFSYNDLIPKLDSDIIILLNNDIKVDPGFISPLISHFKDPNVFGVAPKQMNFNGIGYNGGKNLIEFYFGLINARVLHEDNAPAMDQPGYTHYNANSAFDRKKFIALGGFDAIYYPSTWEDTDLCYRAWKRGMIMVYEPASRIYHDESYTISREYSNKNRIFRNRRVSNRRNSFVFTWKNITDPKIFALHLLLLPLNILIFLFYDRLKLLGFLEALRYLPQIIRKRQIEKFKGKLSDKTILPLINSKRLPSEITNRRPKIGIISDWFHRGVPYQSRFLAKSLKKDFDVAIFAHGDISRHFMKEESANYRFTFAGNDSPSNIIGWIKKERPDLIFTPGRDEHDKVLDWCNKYDIPEIAVLNYETIERTRIDHYRKYANIICPVKCTYDLLSKLGLSNISFIRWAVDTSIYSTKPSMIEGPVKFIHNAGWGGAQWRKNTEAVLTAFDIASKKNNDIKLILKTQRPLKEYPSNVQQLVKRNDRIILQEGSIELGKLIDLYGSCHVSLLPSKWEGIGLPFIESLSLGLPVITVDAPPMNEWIKNDHNGYCCRVESWEERTDPNLIIKGALVDIDDYASQIIRFSDPKVVENMRNNCIETARKLQDDFINKINEFTMLKTRDR